MSDNVCGRAIVQIAKFGDRFVHWREDGSRVGKAVVFANSLGTDFRLWDKVVPLLPGELRYVRFDKRGHGLSSAPKGPYSIDDLAQDAVDLLDHIGIHKCIFVGLSIGGLIAQRLASCRPELIDAIVLSNTAAKVGTSEMWTARIDAIKQGGAASISSATMERWFAPAFLQSEERLAWETMLARTDADGYIACCQAIASTDLTEDTAVLRLPTLGIAGSHDGATPPELVKDTVALVPGSRCVVIENTGHLPCVEKPEAYAALITTFFKECGYV